MSIIGQRFEEGDCFVPELILAGEILRQISDVVKPHTDPGGRGQETRSGGDWHSGG